MNIRGQRCPATTSTYVPRINSSGIVKTSGPDRVLGSANCGLGGLEQQRNLLKDAHVDPIGRERVEHSMPASDQAHRGVRFVGLLNDGPLSGGRPAAALRSVRDL